MKQLCEKDKKDEYSDRRAPRQMVMARVHVESKIRFIKI